MRLLSETSKTLNLPGLSVPRSSHIGSVRAGHQCDVRNAGNDARQRRVPGECRMTCPADRQLSCPEVIRRGVWLLDLAWLIHLQGRDSLADVA
jgi:hypothetical protein